MIKFSECVFINPTNIVSVEGNKIGANESKAVEVSVRTVNGDVFTRSFGTVEEASKFFDQLIQGLNWFGGKAR